MVFDEFVDGLKLAILFVELQLPLEQIVKRVAAQVASLSITRHYLDLPALLVAFALLYRYLRVF